MAFDLEMFLRDSATAIDGSGWRGKQAKVLRAHADTIDDPPPPPPPPPPPDDPPPPAVTVVVPNLVGLSESAAIDALTGLDLTVGTVTNPGGGAGVTAQSPAAGAEVESGTAVNFTVKVYVPPDPPPPDPPPPPPGTEIALTLTEDNVRPSTFAEVRNGDQQLSGRVEGVQILGDAYLRPDTTLFGCEVSGAIIAQERPTLIDTAYGVGWSGLPRDAGKRRGPDWMNSFSVWNNQTNKSVVDGYLEGVVGYGPTGQGAYQLHPGLVIVRSIMANWNQKGTSSGGYHSTGSSNGGAIHCVINDVRYIMDGPGTGFISFMGDFGSISDIVHNRCFFDSAVAKAPGWAKDVQVFGSGANSNKKYPVTGVVFNDSIHGPDRQIYKGGRYYYEPGSAVKVNNAHLVNGTPL